MSGPSAAHAGSVVRRFQALAISAAGLAVSSTEGSTTPASHSGWLQRHERIMSRYSGTRSAARRASPLLAPCGEGSSV